ncbi:unnamed protein product [Cochlearia groenlandica]
MSQTVVLKVGMSCQGCVGAVNRVLAKMEGVESFDIDIKEQKVTVKGNVEPEAVFQTVSKTGKKTSYWLVEAKAKAEPLAEAEAKAEPKAEAEAKAKPKAEAEAKSGPKAEAEAEAKAEPVAKGGAKAESKAEDGSKVEAEIEAKSEVETKTEEAKADVEPKVVETETKPSNV